MLTKIELEIAESRRKILGSFAGASNLTLIRGYGNIGDELIFAGTRQLLSGLRYREVSVDRLDDVHGDLGLVAGGGAWCEQFHYMARHLSEIESRFARVIVLPSSYEPATAFIREVIAGSRALFFARERVSYEQIRGLCRADLAHDAAFFFDYSPYRSTLNAGEGVLVSFRTDHESSLLTGEALPPENDDISLTCRTLDEWLWTIARSESVQTDRAHVMIAAALLGKRVGYRTTKYHKVPAIADFALHSLPVVELGRSASAELAAGLRAKAEASRSRLPEEFTSRDLDRDVTVIRRDAIPNGSDLAAALEQVSTRYVLVLDAGVEPMPGAIEHLLCCLERGANVVAATGSLVASDGAIIHSGADAEAKDGVLRINLLGRGCNYQELIGASGHCLLIPPGWVMFDREALRHEPLIPELAPDLDLVEWSWRVESRRRGRLFRSVEALALQSPTAPSDVADAQWGGRPGMAEWLPRYGHFHRRHDLLVETLFADLPDFGPPSDPRAVASARLLLSIINECGYDWVRARWDGGDLVSLFPAVSSGETALRGELLSLRQELSEDRRRFAAVKQTRAWKLLTLHWRLLQAFRGPGHN